jgi:hypothetical protein
MTTDESALDAGALTAAAVAVVPTLADADPCATAAADTAGASVAVASTGSPPPQPARPSTTSQRSATLIGLRLRHPDAATPGVVIAADLDRCARHASVIIDCSSQRGDSGDLSRPCELHYATAIVVPSIHATAEGKDRRGD